MQRSQRIMMNLGIEPTLNLGTFRASTEAAVKKFKADIKAEYSLCSQSNSVRNLTNGKKFKLGEFEFPMTVLCVDRNLYVLRQPGDFLEFARMNVAGPKPQLRLFFGSKPISVDPF